MLLSLGKKPNPILPFSLPKGGAGFRVQWKKEAPSKQQLALDVGGFIRGKGGLSFTKATPRDTGRGEGGFSTKLSRAGKGKDLPIFKGEK